MLTREKFKKPVYAAAGFYTISMGSGRKEFHPKKPRPDIEYYIIEAGGGSIAQIKDPSLIDEGIISNFMSSRFNRQGHLGGFIPHIHPDLKYLPCTRTEGACCSGGVALVTAVKSVLSGLSDVVLAIGVEVQNTVKAIYGADILAGAGYYKGQRKKGHAYFFPGQFSDRAGSCMEKFGKEKVRTAMAHWYAQAIEHARLNQKAQEYHNKTENLIAAGMMPPNPKAFCDNINIFDCSKVSDAGAALVFASREGLEKLEIPVEEAAEVVGFGHSVADITKLPEEPTMLSTTASAVKKAYEMTGLSHKDISVMEVHDCFTIGGILSMEAAGFAGYGEGYDFVAAGKSKRHCEISTNTSGGLIGYGHPTGASGVRQAVDILHQLTGKAGDYQVKINPDKPHGMLISMGGNDITVVAMIMRKEF